MSSSGAVSSRSFDGTGARHALVPPRRLALTALLLVVAGCTSPPAGDQTTRLTATLDTPTDITLAWQGREPGAAGRVVEFATEPGGQYTILQFVPVKQTTYTHPDLIPETPFYYRLRPFLGPATAPVEVTLPAGEFTEKDNAADHAWAAPGKRPQPAGSGAIRAGEATAEPTDLVATVMHANGIRFTWTDHARDEEGYLIEVKVASSADYRVAMVVDPDVNSAGLITLPEEKKASYRVRAYYYGKSSNVAHLKTGKEAA